MSQTPMQYPLKKFPLSKVFKKISSWVVSRRIFANEKLRARRIQLRPLRFETLEKREMMAADLTFGQVPQDMTSSAYVFIGDHSGSNTEKWSMNIGGFPSALEQQAQFCVNP